MTILQRRRQLMQLQSHQMSGIIFEDGAWNPDYKPTEVKFATNYRASNSITIDNAGLLRITATVQNGANNIFSTCGVYTTSVNLGLWSTLHVTVDSYYEQSGVSSASTGVWIGVKSPENLPPTVENRGFINSEWITSLHRTTMKTGEVTLDLSDISDVGAIVVGAQMCGAGSSSQTNARLFIEKIWLE